jgi:hypothetical protein
MTTAPSNAAFPENVIGVGVGINDVPNRLRRHCADRRQQPAPFAHGCRRCRITATALAADDKSDVGDGALVLPRHHGDGADVDIEAGRDLGHGQRIGGFARPAAGMAPRSVATKASMRRRCTIARTARH